MVDFAVNQQAEQIIFEVEPDGHIVAHVLITYVGDPESFAWLVPVPTVPELELSFSEAFGLIDAQTSPQVAVTPQNICPSALYYCQQHPMPYCGGGFGGAAGTSAGTFASAPTAGMGGSGGTGGDFGNQTPPVVVFSRAQIGAYDTIVFGAGDAMAAVDWLQDEGFIVNDTMSPYMQPYLDENMLFVAAKLVPGADVDAIRPLRMRFEGDEPMIPLQLTAVATQPNLTVTAYIYGDSAFIPQDQKTLFNRDDIPDNAIAAFAPPNSPMYRTNYPMVLARMFDEEGGHAFMLEYSASPPRFTPPPLDPSFGFTDCCAAAQAGVDTCGVIGDGECQCPLDAADEPDCNNHAELVGGVQLVQDLSTKYARMTRITTRLSAEEMTFDPMFEKTTNTAMTTRIQLTATPKSLSGCEDDVIEEDAFAALFATEGCATVYCGRGTCAATSAGVGCACDDGFVARAFTDLDGLPSVTCVPEEAPVDLAAGGLDIPDICGTLSATQSADCVNLAGFAGMRCGSDEAAVLTPTATVPTCSAITHDSGRSGALDYSAEYADIEICAPKPPMCDARVGWLVPNQADQRASVIRCDSSKADPSWLVVPPVPTCDMIENGVAGNGGSGGIGGGGTSGAGNPFMPADTSDPRPATRNMSGDDDGCSVARGGFGSALAPALLALLWLARRRRARTAGVTR